MREMNFLLILTLQGIPQLLTYNIPVKVTPELAQVNLLTDITNIRVPLFNLKSEILFE